MKQDVSVSVSKSAYDLGQGVSAFLLAVKAAGADGYTAADIPAVMMGAYSDLFSKMSDLAGLKSELEEDKVAFLRAWVLSGMDVAAKLFP